MINSLFEQFKRPGKYFILALITTALFIYKLFLFKAESGLPLLAGEILVFLTTAAWLALTIQLVHHNLVKKPLMLVIYPGIIAMLLFFAFLVFGRMEWKSETVISGGIVANLFFTLVSFVYLGVIVIVLSSIRELFFLGQKRDPRYYFFAMLLIFSVAFFLNDLRDPGGISELFIIFSGIVIFINSLRVTWIAFLIKQHKIYLIMLALVFVSMFAFNFTFTLGENFLNRMILDFSPGLSMLFRLTMLYATVYLGVVFWVTLFHLPTAAAYDRKAVEATSLKDLNKLITRVFDIRELANTVTAITAKVCNSDSAWLVTREGDGFKLNAVKNIDFKEADRISRLLLDNHPLDLKRISMIHQKTINDLDIDQFNSRKLKTIAVAPLRVYNHTSGFLFAACRQDFGFDDEDEQTVGAFADYAAVALENARLLEERLVKERLEKEMDVAREIQEKILPHQAPQYERLVIASLFRPAFEVGGDYYDFFQLGPGKLGIVIADVSGKGISAAFIMAEVKGIFESLSKEIDSPKELLERANDILKKSLEKDRFVTAIYGIIDVVTGTLRFARAGHTPLLICSRTKVRRTLPKGVALGMVAGNSFTGLMEETQEQLRPGDRVVFYTDGITEAKNEQLEDFGSRRFEQLLTADSGKTPEQLTEKVIDAVTAFSGSSIQHDDITLVIMEWGG